MFSADLYDRAMTSAYEKVTYILLLIGFRYWLVLCQFIITTVTNRNFIIMTVLLDNKVLICRAISGPIPTQNMNRHRGSWKSIILLMFIMFTFQINDIISKRTLWETSAYKGMFLILIVPFTRGHANLAEQKHWLSNAKGSQ